MEIHKFTHSVRMAIQFILDLTRHDMEYIHSDLTQARWDKFDFFDRIQPGRIVIRNRVEPAPMNPAGYWEISRIVDFHVRGHLVAVVYMIGHRYPKGESIRSYDAWSINHIYYARQFDDSTGSSDWIDCRWISKGLVADRDDILRKLPRTRQ